jgi:hypothetical protein
MSVHAGYDFPQEISDYIKKKGLNYSSPIGSFDKYLIDFYKNKGVAHEPWSVVADFNGDNIADFSGLMRSPTGKIDLVVFYSFKGGLIHKVLLKDASEDNDSIYIAVFIEPPGKVHGFPFDNLEPKDLVADLKHPGIHLIFFEKSAVLFYWKDSDFKEIWTAD